MSPVSTSVDEVNSRPPRRALLLGAAGVGTAFGLGAWATVYRELHADIALYSHTVAFDAQGERTLVDDALLASLIPGTRVLDAGSASQGLLAAEEAFLASSAPWVAAADDESGTLRSALLDLHVLSAGLPVSVAGWSSRWRYAWPRDVSFVAVALARAGHTAKAAQQLRFLQQVQRSDGWFEARYDLATRAAPDGRAAQLDGTGWVLWACAELTRAAPQVALSEIARLRRLIVASTSCLVDSLDEDSGLPPVAPDYWEIPERRLTLGTAAVVLTGLRNAVEVLELLDETRRARRAAEAAAALEEAVWEGFGPHFPRELGTVHHDAAVTFLCPPLGTGSLPATLPDILDAAQEALARPAGGLAPGAGWKQDGVSWTPETALFALARAGLGDRERAHGLLDWLGRHRTQAGSYPEKVLFDGRPAAVAPLAWTAACVVLAHHELAGRP